MEIEQAKDIALRYLSVRARSTWEVRQHLIQRGVDEATVDEVVERLTRVALLDDDQFARAWVRSRRQVKSLSGAMLRRELVEKGIATEVIEEVVGDLGDSETGLALEFARRRAGTMAGLDRTTIMRRLGAQVARRGFPAGIVQSVVMQVVAEIGSIEQ